MPDMTYQPIAYNDKSALTDGWHPAYLLAITDEPTPESWKMFAQSPRMWRWHFCVWATPDQITQQAQPERQSAPSSQKFTPKGKQPASKAYAWTSALLQRQIPPGECVNLDPLMPLPCRVKVSRNGEYANIIDLEAWPEGTQQLTPEFKHKLVQFYEHPTPAVASTGSPAQTPQAAAYVPPPPPVAPGMQSWGTTGTQTSPAVSQPPAAVPAKAAW